MLSLSMFFGAVTYSQIPLTLQTLSVTILSDKNGCLPVIFYLII
jgi:hypothetical protein